MIRVYESKYDMSVFITDKELSLDNCCAVQEFESLDIAEEYAYMNYTIYLDKDLTNESQFSWEGADAEIYLRDANSFEF